MTRAEAQAELERLQAIWQKNATPKMVTSYSFSNQMLVSRMADLHRFLLNAKDDKS